MLYVVIAFMVIVFTISIIRLRRGGPGPAVNYVPRCMRPRLNSFYERRGWQVPYDDQGNRNPDRRQV